MLTLEHYSAFCFFFLLLFQVRSERGKGTLAREGTRVAKHRPGYSVRLKVMEEVKKWKAADEGKVTVAVAEQATARGTAEAPNMKRCNTGRWQWTPWVFLGTGSGTWFPCALEGSVTVNVIVEEEHYSNPEIFGREHRRGCSSLSSSKRLLLPQSGAGEAWRLSEEVRDRTCDRISNEPWETG